MKFVKLSNRVVNLAHVAFAIRLKDAVEVHFSIPIPMIVPGQGGSAQAASSHFIETINEPDATTLWDSMVNP
jgi:hypothetical protein